MGTKKNCTGEGDEIKPLTEINAAKRVQKIKKARLIIFLCMGKMLNIALGLKKLVLRLAGLQTP